jgi:hypothetical protein
MASYIYIFPITSSVVNMPCINICSCPVPTTKARKTEVNLLSGLISALEVTVQGCEWVQMNSMTRVESHAPV